MRRALLAALLALEVACAAPAQPVRLESDPPGAEVYLDGELAGATPLQVDLPTGSDHSVFLKKDGYRAELVVLSQNRSADGLEFLTPADVLVRLVPLSDPRDRDLELEVED